MSEIGDVHAPLAADPAAEAAIEAYLAGVAAGEPARLVRAACRASGLPKEPFVVAVGKAAAGMVWGLVEAGLRPRGVGVVPSGVRVPDLEGFAWHRGDHPLPGRHSAAALAAVLKTCQQRPPGPALGLLSGGASSLLEDDDPERLANWRAWAAEGLDITSLNARRRAGSRVKGGGLARLLLKKGPLQVFLLADAPERSVGSGPFDDPAVPHHVLATNDDAVAAAGLRLATHGFEVYRHAHPIAGPTDQAVEGFLRAASSLGPGTALVAGGETHDPLPADAPPGGRCALAAAHASRRLRQGQIFLAGATDGQDGGPVAAVWVDGSEPDPGPAITSFTTTAWARQAARTVETGPSGTNLNDLFIVLHQG